MNSTETLIIGCGYTGKKLGQRLVEQGQSVTGTVSTAAGAAALDQLGINPLVLDLDSSQEDVALPKMARVFYFAPPPGDGQTDPRLGRVLSLLKTWEKPARVVYTSTTGVYGDCQGEWVTEDRPLNPTSERSQRRADAENQLLQWLQEAGGEAVILRVAGIYGPGRLPLERLRQGAPMVRAEEAPWSNRIQVDDLVSVCLAAMERGHSGQAYNVSDGTPGTMAEYFNTLADLTGQPRPPAITMAQAREALSPGLLSYLTESRRLDNSKMLKDLDLKLKYPGLKQGLEASL